MSKLNLDSLSAEQLQAVTALHGPVMVLAGPGSGKTRVLTHRVIYLAQELKIPEYRITAVTFTNKAASEMRERVYNMLGHKGSFNIGTFHAICGMILRLNTEYTPYTDKFTIYDTDDQKSILKEILKDLELDPKNAPYYLHRISSAKNKMIFPNEYIPTELGDRTGEIYAAYMQQMRKNDALDFDDLLMETVMLLHHNPHVLQKYHERIQFLMVDEFQDTNLVQYALLRLLTLETPDQNLFVVGDPDQSIYAFRGADIRNLKNFETDYPTHQKIFLQENYRSHQPILDTAMAVIRQNASHIKRDLLGLRGSGDPVQLSGHETDRAEAQSIAQKISLNRHNYKLKDMAIMYRTNAQSRVLEEAMRNYNLPYKIVGGLRFYERREVKDILSFLYVINNPNDQARLMRIINVPTRGIGFSTQVKLRSIAKDHPGGIWAVLNEIILGKEYFPKATQKRLREFALMLKRWIEQPPLSLHDLFDVIIKDTNYKDYLEKSANDVNEFHSRWENLQELRRELQENMNLAQYLEDKALISDLDRSSTEEDSITLMTLHSAKGLEFKVVFLVGLVERILPHSLSFKEPDGLEEERRLFYVGITRAKDQLYISYFLGRGYDLDNEMASRFLANLPEDVIRTNKKPSNNYHSPSSSQWSWRAASTPTPTPKVPKSKLQRGDIVYHSRYGQGVVLDSRVKSDMEETHVEFDNYGVKFMDASFLVKRS